MKKKIKILLDIDDTLIIQKYEKFALHPKYKMLLLYDVTLFSSSPYIQVLADLLKIPYIVKDDDNEKPKADILIDDTDCRSICNVFYHFHTIDDFFYDIKIINNLKC